MREGRLQKILAYHPIQVVTPVSAMSATFKAAVCYCHIDLTRYAQPRLQTRCDAPPPEFPHLHFLLVRAWL